MTSFNLQESDHETPSKAHVSVHGHSQSAVAGGAYVSEWLANPQEQLMANTSSLRPSELSPVLYQRRELVAAAAALLAGCGGGGGGSAASTSSSPKLPAITAGTPPQLRGAGILPHTDWLLSNSYRWANIDYLPNAGANCVRLFLQPFSWVDGSVLLPGQVLANRITESLKLWTDVINAFLAKNVYVI
ncbi:MAG: hypothetical protein RL018_1089, partial [Pseudomonadota bacterium]